jgi:hypothetical protein
MRCLGAPGVNRWAPGVVPRELFPDTVADIDDE